MKDEDKFERKANKSIKKIKQSFNNEKCIYNRNETCTDCQCCEKYDK